ncbi:MAG: histidinol dehydrogenase [Magnetococcales bacterium]|nr:histidinol dehydrogenase [Magnetococcales bacterium]
MSPLPILRLSTGQADFAERFHRLIHWEEGDLSTIEQTVARIVAHVRQRGDAALADYTRQFDRIDLTPETLAFSEGEIAAFCAQVPPRELEALELAAQRIRAYHQWQMPEMGVKTYTDGEGAVLGQRLTPLDRVGLYVPGGRASYPSSVLMNAIPARVAGVRELVMVVPTPDNVVNPLILAAARLAGVDRVFRVGGAQAVAALAFGTASVPAVDKIVGPGNIYVATAKRQVFGQVGIDMIAGPSEILVIADAENDPRWIAADLLSQAEHDQDAQSILITDDPHFADAVERALRAHLETLSRRKICEDSLTGRGALIVARSLEEACVLASQVAPEHLELAVADPWRWMPSIRNAGAIFLGRHTPEAMGDYVAGPNHVLPTSGTARFSSPLGVYDFIKRSSVIACSPSSMRRIGPAASILAHSEGLTAHQLSVDLRLEGEG